MTTDWTTLIREHGPLVWRTAWRILQHDADAGDCFQQTFLAAFQFMQKETVSHWPALLVRLATARALDRLRARKRLSHDALTAEPAARQTDALDAVLNTELSDALRFALTEFDTIDAQLFCLVAIEGWSNREAGEALGMTANHAGVTLYRVRQRLRETLKRFAEQPS